MKTIVTRIMFCLLRLGQSPNMADREICHAGSRGRAFGKVPGRRRGERFSAPAENLHLVGDRHAT